MQLRDIKMEVVVTGTVAQREVMEVTGGVPIVLTLVLPTVVSVLKIIMNEIIGSIMIDFSHPLVYEDISTIGSIQLM